MLSPSLKAAFILCQPILHKLEHAEHVIQPEVALETFVARIHLLTPNDKRQDVVNKEAALYFASVNERSVRLI